MSSPSKKGSPTQKDLLKRLGYDSTSAPSPMEENMIIRSHLIADKRENFIERINVIQDAAPITSETILAQLKTLMNSGEEGRKEVNRIINAVNTFAKDAKISVDPATPNANTNPANKPPM